MQIAAVASRFEIFTVEKSTAENTYGPNSSIAATIGTAKRFGAHSLPSRQHIARPAFYGSIAAGVGREPRGVIVHILQD